MLNIYKKLFVFLIVAISFILISFIWNEISLPLKNTNLTVGFLTVQNYNPFNDTIRYVLIISIPLCLYFFLSKFFFKKKISISKLLVKFDNNKKLKINFYDIKYIFFLIIFFIILQFLSHDHTHAKLDYLHDGDYLTPAYNFLSSPGIWSSAFSSHGGSDIFYAIIAWELFNLQTIGSVRVFMAIFIVFLKVVSIFFILKLINLSDLNKDFKKILFFLLSLVIISFSSFDLPMNYSILSYRDIYYLLFFIFLFDFIYFRSDSSIFLISFISFLTPLLHIDTGIYLNTLLLGLIIYLFILKEFNNLLKILFIYLCLWTILFLLVGKNEFFSFFDHFIYMAKHVDLVHGLEYPQPLFSIEKNEHGFRATKGLIIQLLACIIVLREVFFKENRSSKDKIFLIFLIFMSIIAYKNALGRSDAQHIRMSSDLPLIILLFFTLEKLLKYLQNKQLTFYKNKKLLTFFVITIFSLNTFNSNNFKKNQSLISFIKKNEIHFLDEDSKKFLKEAFVFFNNEKCIFNFTTDISIPYFLKKKTCNKYFSPWLISGIVLENSYIRDLKKIEHNYVLYNSPKYSPDNISTKERLKFINKFLIKNYKKIYSSNGFEILEKLN
jgi:hypothetical protein